MMHSSLRSQALQVVGCTSASAACECGYTVVYADAVCGFSTGVGVGRHYIPADELYDAYSNLPGVRMSKQNIPPSNPPPPAQNDCEMQLV